jgi:hypothetical protein
MILAAAVLLLAGAIVFVLFIRERDLPPPAPENPFDHLDSRKASIYENLRDLQFEYRTGKLSDEDYQKTKLELQLELAKVLAEVDKLKTELGVVAKTAAPAAKAAKAPAGKPAANICPHCGASFERPLKFCGECGKPMGAEA